MDPNMIREQPSLRDGERQLCAEEGAARLQPLEAPANAGVSPNPAPTFGADPAAFPRPEERRSSPRYRCSGTVGLRASGSEAIIPGTLSDISLHGCYVEMPTTFPLDTEVALEIESGGIRLSARARVRATYPFLGMGMCFAELEPQQSAQLRQLIKALTSPKHAVHSVPMAQPVSVEMVTADPQRLVNSLMEYFTRHGLLSRDEFFAIAKRVRRR